MRASGQRVLGQAMQANPHRPLLNAAERPRGARTRVLGSGRGGYGSAERLGAGQLLVSAVDVMRYSIPSYSLKYGC